MSRPPEIQRPYWHVEELLSETHRTTEKEAGGYIEPLAPGEGHGLIPEEFARSRIANFPQLSEIEVVRHFTRLSQLNVGIDAAFYPLGSCTMKYNPKVNDRVAAEEGFAAIHPATPEHLSQGALEIMYRVQEALIAITGLKGCSVQPSAGAQGELVGVKMIRAWQNRNGGEKRNTILIPDSAHGTNPASAALSGFQVKQIKSGPRGILEMADIEQAMNDQVAGLMVTVPNTLGLFEDHIVEITRRVHERGGLIYCDGANLNALVGKVDFGAVGIDVMHINLHKTFSTPHGGGGPGAGPVVVSDPLLDYLPVPLVREREGTYYLDSSVANSVGRFRANYGNFGILVRALCYIYAFGGEGISKISEGAVLNANYVRHRLKNHYHLPYDGPTMHEVVFSDRNQEKESGVTALDISKRLIDFGFHPPTMYFPLIVRGALMIEPTETESRHEIDRFTDAMIAIAEESKSDPDRVKKAPHTTGLKRLDEVKAARQPVLTWNPRQHKA